MTKLLGSIKKFLNYELADRVEGELEAEYGYSNLERVPQTRHNYTFKTGRGTVVKYFTDLSLVELDLAVLHLLHGNLSIPTASARVDSELRFRDRFPGVNTPEVINRDERILEEEEVKAKKLTDALEDGDADPREEGRRLGEILRGIDSSGFLIWDVGLDDFLYDGELWLTDAEWFSEGNSLIHDYILKAHFYTSSKDVGQDIRQELLEGFEEGYGKITAGQKILGIIAYYLF